MTETARGAVRGLALRVLLPFAGGFFLSFIYRSVNAIIAPDLATEFALSPGELGLLTSAYFAAFAVFQLPVGVLLDRYGPRRTDASLLLVAALGAATFAAARDFTVLALARALIGLGVSAGLMAGLKANAVWFAPVRLPAMNAWMFFAGGMGMVAATWPVELVLTVTSWRGLFWVLAALTVTAALVIARIVPEKRSQPSVEPLRNQLAALAGIFGARRFWQIAAAATSMQATSMAVQGLWAGPWLRDVAGLSRPGVAAHLLIIALAAMTGFLFWGNFASWLARRGVSSLRVFAAGMAVFLCLQLVLVAGVVQPAALLWGAIGLFGTAGSLSYALLCQRFPLELAGRVNTALNTLVFGWAFVVQWGMGLIINRWPVVEGHYDPAGYRAGFAVFLFAQAAGLAWMLLARGSTSLPPSERNSG